jgi:hypothetical protein
LISRLDCKHFDCFRIYDGVIMREDHNYILGILEMIGRCYLPKKSKKDVPKLVKFFSDTQVVAFSSLIFFCPHQSNSDHK